MSDAPRSFAGLSWSPVARPVIGMIHLRPLPGAPGYAGDVAAIREAMFRDADALVAGGVHALMIENYGDVPFYPGPLPPETIAGVASLATLLKTRFDLPLGVNMLRNDGRAAIATAAACGAEFVRINVLSGARLTDQGVVSGQAHDVLRARVALRAERVRILADVNVKHSAPLALRPLRDEVSDLLERGGADGLIATGVGTGAPVDLDELAAIRAAAGGAPLLVGSGASAETLPKLWPLVDGFIVGSAFKRDGRATNAVDRERVAAFLRAWSEAG